MQELRYWVPSRRELVAEAIAVLALPTYNLIQSIVSRQSPSFVVLTTLGAVVLAMAALALWEWLRQPFRRRVLTGKELIDTVDVWLRENGYGRAPYFLEGYSHTIIASHVGLNVYISVEPTRNILTFAGARREAAEDTEVINLMTLETWLRLKNDFAIEMARFGAYFQTADSPYSITFWTLLPVDAGLNEAKILERLDFIGRADTLVSLIFQRTTATTLLTRPTAPTIADILQSQQAGGPVSNP